MRFLGLTLSDRVPEASIIKAPRQRMTQEEKTVMKEGGIPQAWQGLPTKLA